MEQQHLYCFPRKRSLVLSENTKKGSWRFALLFRWPLSWAWFSFQGAVLCISANPLSPFGVPFGFRCFSLFHPPQPSLLDLWCEPEAEACWDVSQSKSIPPPDGSDVGSNSGRYHVRRRGHEGGPNRTNQALGYLCVCARVCTDGWVGGRGWVVGWSRVGG